MAIELDSLSKRLSATYRPPIFRGKIASPLLAAAAPTSGVDVKVRKSVVESSCWETAVPSKAV